VVPGLGRGTGDVLLSTDYDSESALCGLDVFKLQTQCQPHADIYITGAKHIPKSNDQNLTRVLNS
jgi:hypothetical protein